MFYSFESLEKSLIVNALASYQVHVSKVANAMISLADEYKPDTGPTTEFVEHAKIKQLSNKLENS
jgi:hypothetical protein